MKPNIRVGYGYDVHQLKEGKPFWLGGIKVEHTSGAVGHSDADVLIHVICDALLGAANMRDIGFHFSDQDPKFKGIDSKILLKDVMVLIANNISDTCRVWDTKEMSHTDDGDLSEYIDRYPEHTGMMLKSGEVAKISIFTPHECISQKESGFRQFFRIVGKGVTGREEYFTVNPLLN